MSKLNFTAMAIYTAVNTNFKTIGYNTKNVTRYKIYIDTQEKKLLKIRCINNGVLDDLTELYFKFYDNDLSSDYDKKVKPVLEKNKIILGKYAELDVGFKDFKIRTHLQDGKITEYNF